MPKLILFSTLFLFSIQGVFAQTYQDMMNDYRYNFYDVVREADKHFDLHGTGEGSGNKGFQRWKSRNEGRFYPSGDRSQISPYFVENSYRRFVSRYVPQAIRNSQSSWKDLGPYRVGPRTLHYATGLGRVECFYVDPNNDQRMYLGSRSGGFWRTIDGGKNWQNTTDTMPAAGVDKICVSPTNPDSVWINVRNSENGYSHGIYVSANGGLNWDTTWFHPSNGFGGLGDFFRIEAIVFSPHDAKLMYVSCTDGIYRSTDRLKTQTRVHTRQAYEIAFHPLDDQIVYAYGNMGSGLNSVNRVYRSLDGGLNFNRYSSISANGGQHDGVLATSSQCPDCVWYASTNGIWLSTQSGTNFNLITNPPQVCGGFAISDQDTSKMIYGFVDLMNSTNGGRNFQQVTYWNLNSPGSNEQTNYIHADVRIAQSINGVFYVGTDGYLAKSTDNGVTWTRLSEGTGIRENYRLGVSQSEAGYTVCGSQDNGTSILTDTGWVEWYGADGMEALFHPLNSRWVMGSTQYGGRFWDTNGGTGYRSGFHPGNKDWIAPLLFDHNDPFTVYSFANEVYKTTEFGKNWVNLGSTGIGSAEHAEMAYNNTQIWAVANDDELVVTTNGGNTFVDVSSNLPTFYSISSLTFDPNHDSTLIITYDRYSDNNRRVYLSRNLGQSWENISYNLSAIPVSSIIMDRSQGGVIYAGGEIGVYFKAMADTVWQLLGSGLPSVTVRDLKIHYGSNTLRAATWGRGLWEIPLPNRADFPKILTVIPTEKPSDVQPVEDLPIDVESRVSYSGNLAKVYLNWSKDDHSLNQSISMSVLQDSTWKTDQAIPAFPAGTKVFFEIVAIGDQQDTSVTYRFMYEYRPCLARPNVTAQASKTEICTGDSVVLSGSGAQSYSWDQGVQNGQAFYPTQTQTYTLTGRNADQCAGTDQVTVVVNTLDLTLSAHTGSWKVAETGASYQWLDCHQQRAPIAGETGQTYTPGQSGSFAVEVTKGNCVDTSECTSLSFIDPNVLEETSYSLFPNPGKGVYILQFKEQQTQVRLNLYDLTGKLEAHHQAEQTSSIEWDVQHLAAGTYTLKIQADDRSGTIRVVKE